MDKLGQYLVALRKKHNYSQKYVYEQTGISDSIQSRIERGENDKISPNVLTTLAEFYDISVIDLFIVAGFITTKDLERYKRVFKYSELLTDYQYQVIQENINCMTGHSEKEES